MHTLLDDLKDFSAFIAMKILQARRDGHKDREKYWKKLHKWGKDQIAKETKE